MATPAFPTLRLPLMRYSALLNGPNQEPEDGLLIMRVHSQAFGSENVPAVPLFRRTTNHAKVEPDEELESLTRRALHSGVLSRSSSLPPPLPTRFARYQSDQSCCMLHGRQFHNLKAIIQLELTRPEPTEVTLRSFPEDSQEGAIRSPFDPPQTQQQSPPPPPQQQHQELLEEFELHLPVEELDSDMAAPSEAPASSEDASAFSEPLDESLSSVFLKVRDSLRGGAVATHAELGDEAEPVDEPGEPTDLMRHAAALSANGFFRVSAITRAPKMHLTHASASTEAWAPPPPTDLTEEDQRWLNQVSQMEDSTVMVDMVEASDGGSQGLPSRDELVLLDRQLSDAEREAQTVGEKQAPDKIDQVPTAVASTYLSDTGKHEPAHMTAADFRAVLENSRRRYRLGRA